MSDPRNDSRRDTRMEMSMRDFVGVVATTPSTDRVEVRRQDPGETVEECPSLRGIASGLVEGDFVYCKVLNGRATVIGAIDGI